MRKTLAHLKKDPVLRKVIEKIGKPDFVSSHADENLYVSIVENIIGQQLSSGPANMITERFWNLFEIKYPTPDEVLRLPDKELRAVGMSWAKASYIKNLSREISEGRLNLERIKTLGDEEVIEELVKVKGIGRWTAEMILMFHLDRPDVFSLVDLVLLTAVSRLYGVDRADSKKIEKISISWKPYRALASRYLWRSLGE